MLLVSAPYIFKYESGITHKQDNLIIYLKCYMFYIEHMSFPNTFLRLFTGMCGVLCTHVNASGDGYFALGAIVISSIKGLWK